MDIAPVGLQMTYANANAATQVQHNLNHASALQQSFAAVEQERENELKQKQVRNKDDTEGGTIKDDPERRNRNGGHYYRASGKRQQSEEQPVEKFATDPKRGRHLDISF